MTYVEDILKAVEKATPEEGFNVVVHDTFVDDPAEALTVVKHCDTREEAEKFKDEFDEEIVVYIYGK